MRRPPPLLLASSLLVTLASAGCEDDSPLVLGAQCDLSSDCDSSLVCRFERCRVECRSTRDCALGQLCVLDNEGLGACRLDEEDGCTNDDDCVGELVCIDGQCTTTCEGPADCSPGAHCRSSGGCADLEGTSCGGDDDCASTQVCDAEGRCRDECLSDGDCREGASCADGTCRPGAPAPDAGPRCSEWTAAVGIAEADGEIGGGAGLRPDGEMETDGSRSIHMGTYSETPLWSFFRFTIPEAVPEGATLERVILEIHGKDRTESWDPSQHALAIEIEDSVDAPVVMDTQERPDGAEARPTLETFARWPAEGGLDWEIDTYNASPDFASALQGLIDAHAGFPEGGHVQLWLRGAFSAADAEVATRPYGSVDFEPPRLTVRWCPPEG